MRYLCNIGDSLLTSGICAWRVALLWCVCIFVLETRRPHQRWHRAAQGQRLEGEIVAGDRNFRSSDKNLCLPQLFFLPPVTGFSVTRKQANGHKHQMLPPSATTKRYHQALPPNASSNGGDASRVGAFFSSLVSRREKAINKGSQKALITCLSVSLCLNAPTRDAPPPLVVAFLLAPNTITKHYHQTLALMGATRLASGHFSAASSRVGKRP